MSDEQLPCIGDHVERTAHHDAVVGAGSSQRAARPPQQASRASTTSMPRPAPASATTSAGSARGESRRTGHDGSRTRRRATARASPPGRGPTACRRPRWTRLSSANSSTSASASARMPATLCAPSTITSGWRPTTSSRPGTSRPREAPLDHLLVERGPEERLGRGQCARSVVTLMSAVEREQHLSVRGARGANVDEAAPDREPVADRTRSPRPAPTPVRHRRRRPPSG